MLLTRANIVLVKSTYLFFYIKEDVMTTSNTSKKVLHLIEGEQEIVMYKSLDDMKKAHKEVGWPPYPVTGKCTLVPPDDPNDYPTCDNIDCDGECRLHIVMGIREHYRYCTCK